MKVKFSEKTKNDFKKYRDFLKNTKYSNNKSYQKYQIDGMNNSLKNNIRDDIEDKDEHINSIFPKEYEYKTVIGYGLMFALWYPFIMVLGMF